MFGKPPSVPPSPPPPPILSAVPQANSNAATLAAAAAGGQGYAQTIKTSPLGAAAPEFPFAPIGHGGPGYMLNFVIYRILGGWQIEIAPTV